MAANYSSFVSLCSSPNIMGSTSTAIAADFTIVRASENYSLHFGFV